MPTVKFTSNLKRFFPGLEPMEVNESGIPEMLEVVNKAHPGILDYIVDEQGQLRKHVNIFIGNDLIQDRMNLSDKVREEDEIYIMQALSGG